jgi:flagellar biosynthesis protein FliR
MRIGRFVLAMVLIPWQPLPEAAASIGFIAYGMSIGKEILIGTLIGYSADLAFGAIQMAGGAMGLGSGFESSRIFNPSLGDSGSAFDQIFVMTATVVFLMINGHHFVITAIQKTFEIIPINGSLPFDSLERIMTTTSTFVVAGIHLALPVMTAVILADLTLGFLARVAPQVQVYFLGLPVKVVVSLLALSFMFASLLPYLSSLFRSMSENMLLFLKS